MLKSTLVRKGVSAPLVRPTPHKIKQPKKARPVLHEGVLGGRRQKLVIIAEAATRLDRKYSTLANLVKSGKSKTVAITMPDGSKELLKIVKQGRMNMVDEGALQALVLKKEMVASSTMRLNDVMKKVGIGETTMSRHLTRQGGTLYFEVRSPEGIRRFEVKEANTNTKTMRTEDVLQIKRLLARIHRRLSFEQLADDFKPGNNYDVRETAMLTGFTKNRLWTMIREKELDAEEIGGRLRIKGADIEKYFEEYRKTPKDLVRVMKALEILGHGDRWITRRLVERDGRKFLEYKNDAVSVSIPVHRLNIWKGFSRSELSGLKLIAERVPLRDYLEKHESTHADLIYGSFSGRMSSHVRDFSVGDQRMEELKCSQAPEYDLRGQDIRLVKAGDAILVRPEDGPLVERMVLRTMLHGGESERDAAISVLEGMETITEMHHRLAEEALMNTCGEQRKERLKRFIARYDAGRSKTE